jgi:hypothetical protein
LLGYLHESIGDISAISGFRPTFRQQVKNELNRQACALITGSPARRLVPQIRLVFLDIFSHCFSTRHNFQSNNASVYHVPNNEA